MRDVKTNRNQINSNKNDKNMNDSLREVEKYNEYVK